MQERGRAERGRERETGERGRARGHLEDGEHPRDALVHARLLALLVADGLGGGPPAPAGQGDAHEGSFEVLLELLVTGELREGERGFKGVGRGYTEVELRGGEG